MNRETSPRFAGIGGHHSHKAGTVEWLTPPSIIAALGPFDLDPCAPARQPYPPGRKSAYPFRLSSFAVRLTMGEAHLLRRTSEVTIVFVTGGVKL